MRPQTAAFDNPSFSLHPRSGQRGRLAVFTSFAALVLVVALVVPGTYLIARKATVAAYDAQQPLVRIAEGFGGKTDADSDSRPAPKRPKGVSHPENRTGNALVSSVPVSNPGLRIDAYTEDPATSADEAEPGGTAIAPQLLQRPPPHEGQTTRDLRKETNGKTTKR